MINKHMDFYSSHLTVMYFISQAPWGAIASSAPKGLEAPHLGGWP